MLSRNMSQGSWSCRKEREGGSEEEGVGVGEMNAAGGWRRESRVNWENREG